MTLAPDMNKVSVLFSAEEIKERVALLAKEIANNSSDDLMIVALLRGSFVFTADLLREMYSIGFFPQVDFIALSSYGTGTESSGKVIQTSEFKTDIKGRSVLIIDDILESGRTLLFAKEMLKERGASDIKIAVLMEKPGKLKVDVKADFIGFKIPDSFVVGYGLDWANNFRGLPYIGIVDTN